MNNVQPITKSEKVAILKLHEQGKAATEIMPKFPHLTRQQIAAIKAHATMGTYN